MKKLLYTLLIGLVIVSCQKEEYGGDYAPNALSSDIEAVLDVDTSFVDATIDRLFDIASKKPSKASSITAKEVADGTYLKIAVIEGTTAYEFVFSDDLDSCNPAGHNFVDVFLVRNGSTTDIAVGTTDVVVRNINRDLDVLFGLTFSEGFRFNADGSYTAGAVSGNSFTF